MQDAVKPADGGKSEPEALEQPNGRASGADGSPKAAPTARRPKSNGTDAPSAARKRSLRTKDVARGRKRAPRADGPRTTKSQGGAQRKAPSRFSVFNLIVAVVVVALAWFAHPPLDQVALVKDVTLGPQHESASLPLDGDLRQLIVRASIVSDPPQGRASPGQRGKSQAAQSAPIEKDITGQLADFMTLEMGTCTSLSVMSGERFPADAQTPERRALTLRTSGKTACASSFRVEPLEGEERRFQLGSRKSLRLELPDQTAAPIFKESPVTRLELSGVTRESGTDFWKLLNPRATWMTIEASDVTLGFLETTSTEDSRGGRQGLRASIVTGWFSVPSQLKDSNRNLLPYWWVTLLLGVAAALVVVRETWAAVR